MQPEILLIIPDKEDPERDALATLWANKYGPVLKIGKFWIKPETSGKQVALYGYDSFCLVLAQILDLDMVSPRDEMISELDLAWIKREIELKDISQIDTIKFPAFIKPVMPKLFKGQVYPTQEALTDAVTDIKPEEKILVSNIIAVESEVRTFVLDKIVQDAAIYEGDGNVEEARLFAQQFLDTTDKPLPKTFVLDLGYNAELGWFIIEFNASWGAGLNFCDPEKVLDCIRYATINC